MLNLISSFPFPISFLFLISHFLVPTFSSAPFPDPLRKAESSLVPIPSRMCKEGLVFCATFFVTWGGADLGFEITNQIAEDLIIIV